MTIQSYPFAKGAKGGAHGFLRIPVTNQCVIASQNDLIRTIKKRRIPDDRRYF
jgi:hypothetical protein